MQERPKALGTGAGTGPFNQYHDTAASSDDGIYGVDLNSSDILFSEHKHRFIIDRIASHFGIYDIVNYRSPLHHSTTSRKIIIDTIDRSYFLKQKAVYASDKSALLLTASVQNHLAQTLPALVPRVEMAHDGMPFFVYGGRSYTVSPERKGAMFVGRPSQIYEAGFALATIHNSLAQLTEASQAELTPRTNPASGALDFLAMADGLPASGDDPHKSFVINTLRQQANNLRYDEHTDIRLQLTHGDFAPSNVLFDDDKVVGVVDFDNVAYQARIRDLAEAMLTFGGGINYKGNTSSMRHPIATKLHHSSVALFFKGYMSAISEPLSALEMTTVPTEMRLAWIELMGLGLVRGDFAFGHVKEAMAFLDATDDLAALMYKWADET